MNFLAFYLHFVHLFFRTLQYFLKDFESNFVPENMKKTISKVDLHQFFSELPTGPKPVQISDIFHNLPPRNFSIIL